MIPKMTCNQPASRPLQHQVITSALQILSTGVIMQLLKHSLLIQFGCMLPFKMDEHTHITLSAPCKSNAMQHNDSEGLCLLPIKSQPQERLSRVGNNQMPRHITPRTRPLKSPQLMLSLFSCYPLNHQQCYPAHLQWPTCYLPSGIFRSRYCNVDEDGETSDGNDIIKARSNDDSRGDALCCTPP